ncbi:MAG: hypothetical protein QOJ15_3298, partial [Bradyrhizobium sp.]|nr:hypothetical protein [Bradyrhizobium sp.]
RDGTLITFNRYIQESLPDVVIVGSSVSFRLKEEYFATPSLRNLAIAGGSPLTGLEIVANGKRLPRVVLVEANVLSRSTDAALVEKYSRSDRAEPLFFRPIRTAVLAYENWLHAPLNHTQVSLALSQLLKRFRQPHLLGSCASAVGSGRSDGYNTGEHKENQGVDVIARPEGSENAPL